MLACHYGCMARKKAQYVERISMPRDLADQVDLWRRRDGLTRTAAVQVLVRRALRREEEIESLLRERTAAAS